MKKYVFSFPCITIAPWTCCREVGDTRYDLAGAIVFDTLSDAKSYCGSYFYCNSNYMDAPGAFLLSPPSPALCRCEWKRKREADKHGSISRTVFRRTKGPGEEERMAVLYSDSNCVLYNHIQGVLTIAAQSPALQAWGCGIKFRSRWPHFDGGEIRNLCAQVHKVHTKEPQSIKIYPESPTTACLIIRLWFWHIKPPNLIKCFPHRVEKVFHSPLRTLEVKISSLLPWHLLHHCDAFGC